MSVKVAINGFGRIGRLAFRQMFGAKGYEIVAINDLTSPKMLANLLKYDTAQGGYAGVIGENLHTVTSKEPVLAEDGKTVLEPGSITVDGKEITIYAMPKAEELPWGKLGVDVVLECTGFYCSKEKSMAHIRAGAKKVIISAPAGKDLPTIVFGVNEKTLTKDDQVISAASCTTNCLAPVLNILENEYGIVKGFMTTVHAYTNDQATLDIAHKKGILARRGRACAANIVPASTGAASAIGLVLPALKGKLDGTAMRVPVATGSVIDLTLELKKKVTAEEINKAFEDHQSETIKFTMDPIVSSDVIGCHYGAVVDGLSTNVLDVDGKQLVKVVAWYDNEMSYSSQMVRTAKYLMK